MILSLNSSFIEVSSTFIVLKSYTMPFSSSVLKTIAFSTSLRRIEEKERPIIVSTLTEVSVRVIEDWKVVKGAFCVTLSTMNNSYKS
jgi:hypothetical protein